VFTPPSGGPLSRGNLRVYRLRFWLASSTEPRFNRVRRASSGIVVQELSGSAPGTSTESQQRNRRQLWS
jgi:hypothetical protein